MEKPKILEKIETKVSVYGDRMNGSLDMNNNYITTVAYPMNDTDAATQAYLEQRLKEFSLIDFEYIENDDGTKTTTYTHYNNIKWDSKTGIISGKKTADTSEKAKPIPYVGNALGSIPVDGIGYYGIKTSITHNGGTTNSYDWSDCTLTYHYWYY